MYQAPAEISETANRVLIAANPRAGTGSPGGKVERLASVLRHFQFRVEIYTNLDAVTAAAQRAWQAGELRALVAAGGDGTVAELVNRTAPGVPIAVFPMGTANLLAGYLRIRANFQPFARMLRHGSLVRLDAGRAGRRIFLLMVGCGFDAEVVERLHSTRGGHISMWSYAKPIYESVRSYHYPQLRIRCSTAPKGDGLTPAAALATGARAAGAGDAAGGSAHGAAGAVACLPGGEVAERVVNLTARWVFVVNLPCYAAQLQFAPGALGTDGLLEVATFQYGGFFQGLRYLSYLWSGRHAWLPKSDYGRLQARHIHIEADVPVRYQLDGDPGGLLPLDVEILPNRLTLLAPPERAAAPTRHEA